MTWEPKGDCVVQDDWSAVERYSNVDCECCTGMHFFFSLFGSVADVEEES